jgi:hypothetical protein
VVRIPQVETTALALHNNYTLKYVEGRFVKPEGHMSPVIPQPINIHAERNNNCREFISGALPLAL